MTKILINIGDRSAHPNDCEGCPMLTRFCPWMRDDMTRRAPECVHAEYHARQWAAFGQIAVEMERIADLFPDASTPRPLAPETNAEGET